MLPIHSSPTPGLARSGPLPVAVAFLLAAPAAAQELSFARDVLPILSDRCFPCHGPDARARKANLRLDQPAQAFAERDGRRAIVPGDAAASAMIARITSRDPDEVMPPPESKRALSGAEIATLQRWVESGARWEEHWAFVAPVEPAVPAVEDANWPRGDLDRFVLARLEAAGRGPSPRAEPAGLLRRVTLDLTGVPPTPAELDAFLADPSDEAYARVVDRLLASPRYGERMAWPWLEAARYADTDGYQNDPERTIWPWRDWLIRALNENMPFDRFTIEALAGDLLPDATMDQVLASAFNRNHAHNGEGGRIAAETRVENVFDRTETTATVWMGLTFECARCHDHKFDPISQRDYYGLFAFFDQTSESGAGRPGHVAPTLRYLDAPARRRLAELERGIAATTGRMHAPDAELDAAQAAWAAETTAALRRTMTTWQPVRLGAWSMCGPLSPVDGGSADDLFAAEFGPEPGSSAAAVIWREAPDLVDGRPFALADGVGVTFLRRSVEAASARRLELSFGSDDAIRVWWNGEEVLAKDVRRAVAPDQERVVVEARSGANELLLEIVNTGGKGGVYFRKVNESLDGMPEAVVRALLTPAVTRDQAAERVLLEHYRSTHPTAGDGPSWAAMAAEVAAARRLGDEIRGRAAEVMVMDQLPPESRRTTSVLVRGAYDNPGESVIAAVPGFMPPLPAAAPRDRLTLARWLVSGEHPLTARVAVNRAWQLFFGRGLVGTSENLGHQGDRPSHPALLDWLAARFVASGWDRKALHRAIVTSATYRQSARAARSAFAADPDNELLARGSRHRLPAWMLRDQALALGGLLVERLGGPPVRPYQPEGVWAEASFDTIRYRRDRGDAPYRRSVYVFWRRIVGPTFFFDTAARQTCVVGQTRTNSPLHALLTLNETAFVEAARGFAQRAWREGGDSAASRIAWAFRAATCRRPDAAELQRLLERYGAGRSRFDADPAAAAALLAVGDSVRDPTLPAAELAALAIVTSILLNLDEVLTRS
ncbi:MAG: PSD1 domain-containing protein [Planctomycetes bacterium]|nr:PSD1 domain-containing protein [Planctomycetota bacterium]